MGALRLSLIRLAALCHQAWGAPLQSGGRVSLPGDAAVEQQPQPVVGEVAEAVGPTRLTF